MAELSITAASVVSGSGAVIDRSRLAGETITAGMGVYIKTSDGKYYKAQADGTTEEAQTYGIALHGSLAGQPLAVQTAGQITIGATIAAGVFYYTTTTAGSLGLAGDLSSTNKVTQVGYGVSTTVLQIAPVVTGQVLA